MLDYRFAWRWLLPMEPEQRLYCSGFDEAELAFWHGAFASAELANEPQQADGWIIDVERACFDLDRASAYPIANNIQWVAAIGSGRSVTRWRQLLAGKFEGISEYGLLPAGNPRVLVPLGNPRHTVIALGLHRPGRGFARFALRLSGWTASKGLFFPLRRQVLLIATRERHSWPLGAVQAELPAHVEGVWDYALYLGVPRR